MKKLKILAIGCAVLMSVTLAACGTDKSPAEHVHEWGEWEVTTEPTCVAEGEETRVCELDESHKETRPVSIDPDAHEWGEWVVTKAPSYTEEGEETRTCKNDSKHVETRPVDKLQHAPITEMTLTSSESYSLIRGIADEAQGVTADATAQISLTVTYLGGEEAAATSADVTFASDDPTVASVNEDGLITFNAVGTATITIKSKNEKYGGGYMEETIAVTVNDLPKNETYLEVVSFTVTPEGENQRRIYCDIINNATSEITVMYVDVYYLDETNKVIGQGYLILRSPSGTPVIINPGKTREGGMVGEDIPENIAKVWIYNRRTN